MKPCPVCGAPGILLPHKFIRCRHDMCDMPTVSEELWNTFSDNKLLRDFVMNAEADGAPISCEPTSDGWRVHHPRGEVVKAWLMDAFIALV